MKLKDLTGQRFGRLVVRCRGEDIIEKGGRKRVAWICDCDCGNVTLVQSNSLQLGSTKSCGCYKSEQTSKRLKKYNKYIFCNDYVIGVTINTQNQFIFDKSNYELVKDYLWREDEQGRIYTNYHNKTIRLHRLVMGLLDAPEDVLIDHKDNNPKNNCVFNLRIANYQQNGMNHKMRKDNLVGRTGIRFLNGKWYARIKYKGKEINSKGFATKEEAIKQREIYEDTYFKEFKSYNA